MYLKKTRYAKEFIFNALAQEEQTSNYYLKHRSMFEYAKIILPKVSFSKDLFRKELRKCINWIEQDNLQEFYNWCFENFNEMYPNVLAEAFADIAA